MRVGLTLIFLCAAAIADEKEVEALRAKVHAEYEGQKETWKKYLLDAPALTDGELQTITEAYDRCIELCGKLSEAAPDGDGEADSTLIQLARRTARLRATVFGREMAKKAKAAAGRPKEPVPEKPPEKLPEKLPEPEPQPKPPAPAPPPNPEPETVKATEEPKKSEPPVLPTLEESKEKRSAGIQSVRTFVMRYFADRKYKSLITMPCGDASCMTCAKRVGHLNVRAARRAYWLTRTPLARAAPNEREKWLKMLSEWRNDPRKLPEVLTKLNITKVDYKGLWADVTWEQWGVTNDARKTHEVVERRLVRAGSHWFFYDAELDRDFFVESEE